jgi:hypothetical protein
MLLRAKRSKFRAGTTGSEKSEKNLSDRNVIEAGAGRNQFKMTA